MLCFNSSDGWATAAQPDNCVTRCQAARQLHGVRPVPSGGYVAQHHRPNLVHPQLCMPAWDALGFERYKGVSGNASLRPEPILQ